VAGEGAGEDSADVAAEQGEADGAEQDEEVHVEQQRGHCRIDREQRDDRERAEHERHRPTQTLLTTRHATRIRN
jgi:hypothetical protein